MFGLLNLNKPKGATSRDAVNRVQAIVRRVAGKRCKVGHAGTLDPIATGVLVVCIGPATRLIDCVQQMPKRYRGTFLLGRQSPSDDVELEPEELFGVPVPTYDQIAAVLPQFVGQIEQVPPPYSAVKIKGEKAYDLARRGETVEIRPRTVSIYDLQITRYEYPELVLDIRCGGGTYVRSLGRDLAKSLGTAAVMCELERTAIGEFAAESAISPGELTEATIADHLLPAELAVAELPRLDLSPRDIEEIRHGRAIAPPTLLPDGEMALFDPQSQLIALGQEVGGGKLRPTRVFAPGGQS